MVKVKIADTNYRTEVETEGHHFLVDEPVEKGGGNEGPRPSRLFLASLGTCVAITLRMYANTKGWEIGDVGVELDIRQENGKSVIVENLTFGADLTPEQLERLGQIAKRCPVSKMIEQGTPIESKILENDQKV